MNAEEAYNIAKSAYDVKCAKQLNFIMRQIEECAREGEFFYTTYHLYPENRKSLERFGYTVVASGCDNAYRIEWRNAQYGNFS